MGLSAGRKYLLTCYLIRSPQSFEWPAPINSRLCLIISLQCFRSLANSFILSSTMLGRPENKAASSSTQLSHDFLGRPLERLPCFGVQLIRYLGTLFSGILVTCPNQRSLLAPMYVSTVLILARFRTSVFLMRWIHLIRSIRRKHL